MASDAQIEKRNRYLAEGKIKIMEADDHSATIFAHGSDDQPYIVRFRANAWSCTCPAQKPDCVHVLAAMQISPLRTVEGSSGIASDPELDALLADDRVEARVEYETFRGLDDLLG